MEHFINYIKDTFAELKHVSWPTHRQTVINTILVVVVSALVAIIVSVADFVFTHGLNWFIK